MRKNKAFSPTSPSPALPSPTSGVGERAWQPSGEPQRFSPGGCAGNRGWTDVGHASGTTGCPARVLFIPHYVRNAAGTPPSLASSAFC